MKRPFIPFPMKSREELCSDKHGLSDSHRDHQLMLHDHELARESKRSRQRAQAHTYSVIPINLV